MQLQERAAQGAVEVGMLSRRADFSAKWKLQRRVTGARRGGVPSRNLEGRLSQWGVATGCRGS